MSTEPKLSKTSLISEIAPPILVKHWYTAKKRQFSRNTFYDLASGERYYEDELTALERGRTLTYKTREGGQIDVHMPHMVMDSRLGGIITKLRLKSFLCLPPFIGQTRGTWENNNHRKAVTMCGKDFRLTQSDWNSLSDSLLKSDEFIIRKNSLDEAAIEEEIDAVVDTARKAVEAVLRLRSTVSTATSEEVVDACLNKYHSYSQVAGTLADTPWKISKRLTEAGADPEEKLKVVRIETKMSILREEIESLRNVNFPRLVREAVHRKATLSGEESRVKVVSSLEEELSYLRHHFKPLRFVRGDKDDLIVDLSGVTIRITPDSIRLEGDIAALRPYTTGVSLKGGDSTTSRFSSLRVLEGNKDSKK